MVVHGRQLHGADHHLAIGSAQVKTAILETNGTVTMFRTDEKAGTYHPAMPGKRRFGKRRGPVEH